MRVLPEQAFADSKVIELAKRLLDFLQPLEQVAMVCGQQGPEQLQQITCFLAGLSDIVKGFKVWPAGGDRPLGASAQLSRCLRNPGLCKSSQSRLAGPRAQAGRRLRQSFLQACLYMGG